MTCLEREWVKKACFSIYEVDNFSVKKYFTSEPEELILCSNFKILENVYSKVFNLTMYIVPFTQF